MRERGWMLVRAASLVVATTLLSPISPLLLIAVPAALLFIAFRGGDVLALGLGVLTLVIAFGGAGGEVETGWLVPRAWSLLLGGAFVAATALRAKAALLGRSLVAVTVALLAVLCLGAVRPTLLGDLDWWMASEIRHAASVAYTILGSLPTSGDPALQEEIAAAVYQWVSFQQDVYPALLAVASLAALGVSGYVLGRLSSGYGGLGPLREFRFADQLVWLLVGGLLLLVLPLGSAAFRVGENAAVFMGLLYLLRGLAIMIWVGAAVLTSAWSGWLLALAGLLLYPVVAGTALVLGLSDTWLDLRGRLSRAGVGRRGD